MSAETLEIIQTEYQAGKAAFESGRYRESVQHLEKASALVTRNTRLGGEVQIWLVTAYEATGQQTEAIDLCKQLVRHPHLETRKQSRRLLSILEAPRLNTRPEWLTEIPDLTQVEADRSTRLASSSPPAKPKPLKPPKPAWEVEEPPSPVAATDNRFIVVVGLILLAVLAGWIGLS